MSKTSHSVAELFGVKDRGYIREGCWADIVLVDLNKPRGATEILSKCAWSPFEGVQFKSSIWATIVNGQIIYQDGQIISDTIGKPLEYARD